PEFAAVEFGIGDTELSQRLGRAAVPVRREHIPHVLQILYADLTAPEPGRREIAKAIEEADAVGHAGRGSCGPGDVVQNRFALRLAGIGEDLAESRARLTIEPRQSISHPFLHAGPVVHRKVHELGYTGVRCASRSLVAWNDHIGEDADRSILGGREKLRGVGNTFGRGTQRVAHESRSLLLLGAWPGEKHRRRQSSQPLDRFASADFFSDFALPVRYGLVNSQRLGVF